MNKHSIKIFTILAPFFLASSATIEARLAPALVTLSGGSLIGTSAAYYNTAAKIRKFEAEKAKTVDALKKQELLILSGQKMDAATSLQYDKDKALLASLDISISNAKLQQATQRRLAIVSGGMTALSVIFALYMYLSRQAPPAQQGAAPNSSNKTSAANKPLKPSSKIPPAYFGNGPQAFQHMQAAGPLAKSAQGGLTHLHFAAAAQNPQAMKAAVISILQAGGTLNEKNDYGQTALHVAARDGDTESCVLLLHPFLGKDRVNPNEKDGSGNTALHLAVLNNYPDICSLLLSKEIQADVDPRDSFGNTPLHLAATAGNDFLCGMLLGKGALVNAKNTFGETPLSIAQDKGLAAIVNRLELATPKAPTEPTGPVVIDFAP